MSSIVDKSHLKDITLGMWNKIKINLGAYVHKTKENIVAGKTVLFDGYIVGNTITTLNNTGATGFMRNDTSCFTCENLLVSANQKVGQVTIGISGDKEVGDIVTGVNIGAIKCSDGRVLDYIIQNGTGVVHKNTINELGCDKAITVNVNASWGEDVYIIVGANGALWGGRANNYGGNALGSSILPSVGSRLTLTTGGNYIGKVIIYGEELALRDLANSSGVTREEFDRHKNTNEQQHQTFQNNINTANTSIISQGQRISALENNTAKKNSPNIFTSQNTFRNNSPVVDKYFPIKTIGADGIDGLQDGATYCCNPREGISNSFVSALVVPIHNSRPGDTIQASYFTVNASTFRATSGVLGEKTYTVQDILYKGHYCIVIDVNNTFNYAVAFGFGIRDTIVVGTRRIGLLKTDLPNSNNIAWSSYNRPADADSVGNLSGKFMIPYMITKKATSEVVTRFDLANNTVPMDIYQIGEMKAFAIDMGETMKIGERTWIRCEGQEVRQDENNTISVVTERNIISKIVGTSPKGTFRLPVSEAGKHIYVCAY